MTVQESEKYIRWVLSKHKRINVTPKFIQALECILKAAAYSFDDEVGFRTFGRLWLSQILHYRTVPWDLRVQKEMTRSLLMPTSRVISGISESLGDVGVDRYIDGKSTITKKEFKRIDDIRKIYSPEELEKNLRQMYAQLKLVKNDF